MLTLVDQILAAAGTLAFGGWLIFSRMRWNSLQSRQQVCEIREQELLIAVLAYMGAALVLSGVMQAAKPQDQLLTSLVVNNGAQVAGILACLVLVTRAGHCDVRTFLLGPRGVVSTDPRVGFIGVVALCVVAIGVSPLIRDATVWIIKIIVPEFTFEPHPTLRALNDGQASPAGTVALWVGAALIAPVAEEFFFRGFLLNFVATTTRNPPLAVTLSALAFAAIHIAIPYALPALFFLGILLGAAYLWTRKLYVPIAIHAAFNLKTLIWEGMARNTV